MKIRQNDRQQTLSEYSQKSEPFEEGPLESQSFAFLNPWCHFWGPVQPLQHRKLIAAHLGTEDMACKNQLLHSWPGSSSSRTSLGDIWEQ